MELPKCHFWHLKRRKLGCFFLRRKECSKKERRTTSIQVQLCKSIFAWYANCQWVPMPLPSLIKVILESEENLQAGYPNSRGWRQGDFDYCWKHMRTCALNIWKDKGRVKGRRHLLAEAIHTLAAAWSPVCLLSPLNSHHPHQDHRLGGKFKQFHSEWKKERLPPNDFLKTDFLVSKKIFIFNA